MRLDSDPPRLSSQGDPQIRTALEQARADLPGPDALARLAARLPLGPGPGPSGAPPNGAAAGGGGAGAAGAASSAPMLSSIAIGAAAGVVASSLLWIADPDVLKPPERPDAPAPALVASAEPPRPSVSASEPEIRAPVSAAPKKAPAAPPAPPAAREQKVIASPAEAVSTAGVDPGSSVSGAAPAGENETEASLLTRAQAQMGSNPGGALSLADRHRALFPKGNMVQERELIAVSALVALGRTAEARSRAEAFIAAHPQSAHRRRLSALVPGLSGGAEENP
jgi:hypothetical protein